MSDPKPTTSYLSCAAVARRLGLSRQRFWQLRRDGVFPQPQVDEQSGRQYYTDEQVGLCLDLRKRNVGLNGRIVLFYSPRPTTNLPKVQSRRTRPRSERSSPHAVMIESLRALGLTAINEAQIDEALAAVFPGGTTGVDQSELIRAVFLHVQRQNSAK